MDEKNEKPPNKNQSPTNTEISNSDSRIERDWLGEKEVPADALYGIQTVRALENFPISGQRAIPEFITALAMVKKQPPLQTCASVA